MTACGRGRSCGGSRPTGTRGAGAARSLACRSAPFPVRLQTAVDLAAARFGLLAWEDPYAEWGPVSPFWAVVPMMPAAPRATPLGGDATAPGLSVRACA